MPANSPNEVIVAKNENSLTITEIKLQPEQRYNKVQPTEQANTCIFD